MLCNELAFFESLNLMGGWYTANASAGAASNNGGVFVQGNYNNRIDIGAAEFDQNTQTGWTLFGPQTVALSALLCCGALSGHAGNAPPTVWLTPSQLNGCCTRWVP